MFAMLVGFFFGFGLGFAMLVGFFFRFGVGFAMLVGFFFRFGVGLHGLDVSFGAEFGMADSASGLGGPGGQAEADGQGQKRDPGQRRADFFHDKGGRKAQNRQAECDIYSDDSDIGPLLVLVQKFVG